MKRLTIPKSMLMAAGTAAVTAVSATAGAQPGEIPGTVVFADGTAIPKGDLVVYLDDSAVDARAKQPGARARMASDGGAKVLRFTLPLPADLPAARSQEIVAQLERADGWLLARGSAEFEPGAPVEITLYTVMY